MTLTWDQPRRVDEWLWMDLNEWETPGVLRRCGRVTWLADGTGYFQVSLTYEYLSGLGLYCWPQFRALSDAQDFIERLWALPVEDVQRLHGTQWPGVVL